MDAAAACEVVEARPGEFAAIRAILVEGLAQRWRRYEPSFNPDLEAFDSFYEGALVLVAKSEDHIVGCGILVREVEHRARIVRMSVTTGLQRRGIGGAILRALLDRAASLGYQEVVLETTTSWDSAVALYKRHGFLATGEHEGDQHFRLVLAVTWQSENKDPGNLHRLG